MIFNHYASKLSDLDMQIVEHVPPGGNWKDIPESVPSKRLEQIRESYKAGKGSRSTYYGRLKPDMPSYTINTYFNRPGNGCHIHYEQPRTLTQREAARLQTFPDSYNFLGSKTAINNQIGNAVPPLLAYQIAKKLPYKGKFIDLFCGAGGLGLGFIWAGWTPIVANDIDKYAIETYKLNIGKHTILGDINDSDVFDKIVEVALREKEKSPEVPIYILGGPPCQGFSTANTRRGKDDLRNWLFKSYVRLLREIKPTGFVFENVKGITNLDGGNFFSMIQEEMLTCVEAIKINKINSAEFGVPQRRERIIVIGGSSPIVDSFELPPISQLPNSNQTLLPTIFGVKEALGDLPEISQSEDGSHLDYRYLPQNIFQKFTRGFLTAGEYLSEFSIE